MENKKLCVYIDGGCWPNPGGKMSISVMIFEKEFEIGNIKGIDIKNSLLRKDMMNTGAKYARIEEVESRYNELIGSDSSNNVAEYWALYCAVCEISTILKHFRDIESIVVHSDSALVVNQMKGLWKVKQGNYIGALRLARGAIFDDKLENTIKFVQVPREGNVAGILLEKWQKTFCNRIMTTDNEFSFLREE